MAELGAGVPNTVGLPSPGIPRNTRSRLERRDEVVTLVLDVVAEHDVADPHALEHRDHAVGIRDALLEPTVERVEQIGGARGAVRESSSRRDVRRGPSGRA